MCCHPLQRLRLPITALFLLTAIAPGALFALDPSRAASQHTFRQWRIDNTLPQNSVRAITQGPNGLLWLSTQAGLRWFDGVTFGTLPNRPEVLSNYHVYSLAADSRGGLWIGTSGGGLLYYRDGEYRHYSPEDGFPARVIMSLEAHGDRVWVGSESSGLLMIEDGAVHHWGAPEGIPQNTIHDLAVGPNGDCFAAVFAAGVFRAGLDGRISPISDQQGRLSPMTFSVHVDPDGTLWIGSSAGLARSRDGAWRYWTADTGLPPFAVTRILRDRNGLLWIGSLGGGLFRLSRDEHQLEAVFDNPKTRLAIVWTMFEDQEGSLWIGSLAGGLGRLSDGPILPIGVQEGLTGEYLSSVAEDSDGTLWATTHGSGIQRYRDGTALPPLTVEDGLSSNSAWSLAFDRAGDLWIADRLPAVDRFSSSGIRTYTARDGIAPGRLLGVHGARDGSVWVSGDNGLTRIDPRDDPENPRITLFTTDDGLVYNKVNGVVEEPPDSPAERLWIATNRGVSVWSPETGFTNYTTDDGLRNERVWSILPDGRGNAWIGTFGGGLHRLRAGRIDLVLNSDHGLPSNDVTALLDDGLGHFWLATTRGLARLSHDQLSRAQPAEQHGGPAILRFDTDHGMRKAEVYGGHPRGIRASDGRLLFVSSGGLAVIDPSTIEVTPPPRIIVRDIQLDGQSLPTSPPLVLPPSYRRLSVSFNTDTLITPDRVKVRHRLIGLDNSDEAWLVLDARTVELPRLPAGSYALDIEASDAQGQFHGRSTRVEIEVNRRFQDTWTFTLLAGMLLVSLGIGIQRWRARHLRARQVELQHAVDEAVAKIHVLKGLLPMCASCKKIRDDDGYWQGVETYITDHSEAAFSHGLCPSCSEAYMNELGIETPRVEESGAP